MFPDSIPHTQAGGSRRGPFVYLGIHAENHQRWRLAPLCWPGKHCGDRVGSYPWPVDGQKAHQRHQTGADGDADPMVPTQIEGALPEFPKTIVLQVPFSVKRRQPFA